MKRTPSATEIAGAEAVSSTPMQLSGDYSLYFHIPFCKSKCDYCHFYVIPDQQRFKDIYMQSLHKEWQRAPHIQGNLVSIYFGGGTPALIGPSAIENILSWISPPPDCEITLEVNPENVTLELMQAFQQSGVNRISMGVQTLDVGLLKTLSRKHSAKASIEAVEQTARAGIENISIDLMYDLPGQTIESWQKTLDQALLLPISHLSLYNLTIEPHTAFYKKRKTLVLPDSDTSLQMLSSAVSALDAHHFKRYEISAFAREGKVSRHNSGYWIGRPFLGFGPSACSYWEGSRFRNIANLSKFAKALDEGSSPIDFTETLSPKERLKESLAISLRLLEGTPLQSWPQEIEEGLALLEKRGLLEKTRSHYRLTEQGLLFHDLVAEEIMGF